MDLSTIKPAKGAVKPNKRKGRGQGSGKGGTSTKGHKGSKSRAGNKKKIGFEGGQMPIQRRVPKFGFKNLNRIEYKAINLSTLQQLADDKSLLEFDFDVFVKNGLATKKSLIKILAKGELKSKLTVKAHAFSAKAAEVIEAQGGKIEKI